MIEVPIWCKRLHLLIRFCLKNKHLLNNHVAIVNHLDNMLAQYSEIVELTERSY